MEVSLRFALFLRRDAAAGEGPGVVADHDPGGATRWPTLVREVASGTPMGEQFENLEASGLVGGLFNTLNRHGHTFAGLLPKRTWGPPAGGSWRLLTHAGSNADRAAWLRRLQARMASTAGNSVIAPIT